jgi:hypothetical protein
LPWYTADLTFDSIPPIQRPITTTKSDKTPRSVQIVHSYSTTTPSISSPRSYEIEPFTLAQLFSEIFISVWAALLLRLPKFLSSTLVGDKVFQHKNAWLLVLGIVGLYFIAMFRSFRVLLICHVLSMALYYICHDFGGMFLRGISSICSLVGLLLLESHFFVTESMALHSSHVLLCSSCAKLGIAQKRTITIVESF